MTPTIKLLYMAQLLAVKSATICFNPQINHEGKWLKCSRSEPANERNVTSDTTKLKQHERRRLFHSPFSTCQTGGTAVHRTTPRTANSPVLAKSFSLKTRWKTATTDLQSHDHAGQCTSTNIQITLNQFFIYWSTNIRLICQVSLIEFTCQETFRHSIFLNK